MGARGYFLLVAFTALLAFCVVMLGAYTRLSDAGLGCPDWPGCYGHLTVPEQRHEVDAANVAFPERAVEAPKAWKEMVHRYFAGTLGLSILAIAVISIKRRRAHPSQPVALPIFLLLLVLFQAALGMWTVTLLLKPAIVAAHLLGGLATFALLVLLALRSWPGRLRHWETGSRWLLAGLALLTVVAQVTLGGWTSTNYAALACPDFPTCHGVWWPKMDFGDAFRVWRGTGVNYEYGVLDTPARTAVHVSHRIGALLTLLVVGWLSISLLRRRGRDGVGAGAFVGALLLTQIGLGISNVLFHLPLLVAVLHNAVAALLLVTVLYVNYRLWPRHS